MPSYIYELSKKGKLVYQGKAYVISQKFGINSRDFHRMFNNDKREVEIQGYKVRRKQITTNKVYDDKPLYSSYDQVLGRLIHYGNTICTVDPGEYLDRMAAIGLKVRSTIKYDEALKRDGKRVTRKQKPHWLLEIIWTTKSSPQI